jgi:hypothetical protein
MVDGDTDEEHPQCDGEMQQQYRETGEKALDNGVHGTIRIVIFDDATLSPIAPIPKCRAGWGR